MVALAVQLASDGLCPEMQKLQAKGIVVAHADVVWQALRMFRQGKADFADCLIKCFADEAACARVMTFDRDAVKYCGMQLLG